MDGRPTIDLHKNLQATQQQLQQAPPAGTADLAVFVQNLLQQMTDRFTTMSTNILGRIDELGARIDDLEKQIEDMVQGSGEDEDVGRKDTALQ
ncbi:g2500 [Coccomyxa elongata]